MVNKLVLKWAAILFTIFVISLLLLNIYQAGWFQPAEPIVNPPVMGDRLLIIAPHPDDETLPTAGVIQKAVNSGKTVKVVIITTGDGFRKAVIENYQVEKPQPEDYQRLGIDRHEESVAALQLLGVPRENIIFLGYPDSGAIRLWESNWDNNKPYRGLNGRTSSPYAYALRAEKSGIEVLIHMPMEPEKGKSGWLGPGAIKHTMSREEILNSLNKALEQIPNAVGMNNHMGSLITKKKVQILPVMEFLREHEMFFVNTRTNGSTVCKEAAKEIGVPYAERTLFLDNQYDYNSIRKEILKLAELARANGFAIGIGHVGPQGVNTAKALADTLPLLEEQGIELVFVSELF